MRHRRWDSPSLCSRLGQGRRSSVPRRGGLGAGGAGRGAEGARRVRGAAVAVEGRCACVRGLRGPTRGHPQGRARGRPGEPVAAARLCVSMEDDSPRPRPRGLSIPAVPRRGELSSETEVSFPRARRRGWRQDRGLRSSLCAPFFLEGRLGGEEARPESQTADRGWSRPPSWAKTRGEPPAPHLRTSRASLLSSLRVSYRRLPEACRVPGGPGPFPSPRPQSLP